MLGEPGERHSPSLSMRLARNELKRDSRNTSVRSLRLLLHCETFGICTTSLNNIREIDHSGVIDRPTEVLR